MKNLTMRTFQVSALATAVGILVTPAFSTEVADTESQTTEVIVVTATQEARRKSELAESVTVFSGTLIEDLKPAHPAELLNRSPGVHVNDLGGEGHMTAIRQPISTTAMYLFLEDGIPTRPTGFFNHNGLYEVNIAQAGWVEITKGPGAVLYGSDAIGGIIHNLTAAPEDYRTLSSSLEIGGDGWQRFMVQAATPISGDTRLGVSGNTTRSDGFQENGAYERDSVTARLDSEFLPNWSSKSILSATRVRQSGVSGLNEDDYRNNPRRNNFFGDVGARDVDAIRVSTEFLYAPASAHRFTITPFYRNNSMTLMPPWMVSFDPNVQQNKFHTFGLLTRYRNRVSEQQEWVAGVDIDYSDARYEERRVIVSRDDSGRFVDVMATDRINYLYDAKQQSISPYAQIEHQFEHLRITAGIRYDHFSVDYRDKLDASVPERGVFPGIPFPSTHFRPDSQKVTFTNTSPKFGAVYSLSSAQEVFANYRYGFRAPTVGQLFRSGASVDTESLLPVQALSREIGWRRRAERINVELSVYQLDIKDDILTIIDNEQLTRRNVNAGETRHKGVELGLHAEVTEAVTFDFAYSYAKHTYVDFQYVCGTTVCNFAGNHLSRAPRTVGFAGLNWSPSSISGLRLNLEVNHLGSYFTDETNTAQYGGYQIWSLRSSFAVTSNLEISLRVNNLTNTRYATFASNQVGNPAIEYRPGAGRRGVVAVKWWL